MLKPQFLLSFFVLDQLPECGFYQQVVFNTSFEENRCTGVWFNSSLSNDASPDYFKGLIDDFTYWNRALEDKNLWYAETSVVQKVVIR